MLASGFKISESDKCTYSKYMSSKGVITSLYVDNRLIFGTGFKQVCETKKLLSCKFDIKDIGMADVILWIRIKREQGQILLSQSHYDEKILSHFNHQDCKPALTPIDPKIDFVKNVGDPMSQLDYAIVIWCLMYAMHVQGQI